MHSMAIDRRTFLALSAGAALAPFAATAAGRPIWLAANADAARQYAFGAFDRAGAKVFEIDLPGRGHGVTLSPDGRHAALVARRPGTFAVVVDLTAGRAVRWLETPADRHHHGHGVFSGDGTLFFTGENDFANGRGVIGVWDARDGFRRLGEYPSHGIEPHDLRMMPDGRTLVVANGGIRTHPDSGRARLNLDDMESSLVYMDARDGGLLARFQLPPDLRLQSMRHLSVTRGGVVAIGLQYQGDESRVEPVFGLHRCREAIRLLSMPAAVAGTVRNYCGSIALDASGRIAAASCPRGGLISFWDVEGGRLLGVSRLADGCGVAAGPEAGSVVATSGRGGGMLWMGGAETALDGRYLTSRRWDNHAAAAFLP